jgi:hypothetical protein
MKSALKIALVIIISLLVGLIFKAWTSPAKEERAYEVVSNNGIYVLVEAIHLFKSNKENFPNSLEELVPEYIEAIPKDPWGELYQYHLSDKFFIVFSVNQNKKNELFYSVQKKNI